MKCKNNFICDASCLSQPRQFERFQIARSFGTCKIKKAIKISLNEKLV